MSGEPPGGHLFQERLRSDPFWMLVACVLVNRTNWRQAEPVFQALRKHYPTPERLSRARVATLEGMLRPLGLWRRRAASLHGLSRSWLLLGPGRVNILELPGCGRYAADSWAIFVEGRTDVEPTDPKLRWYLTHGKAKV